MLAVEIKPVTAAKMTPLVALGVVAGLAVALAGYIGIAMGLGIKAFYAGSVLVFYWTTVGNAELRKLPAAVTGSLCGIATAMLFALPATAMGGAGALLGLLVIAVAVYVLLVGWARWVVNPAYMLMLTITAIPPVLAEKAFLSMAEAVCLAALYVGALVGLGQFLMARKKPASLYGKDTEFVVNKGVADDAG